MIDILFVAPTSGNGGIVSWAKKMLASFSDEKYRLYHVNVARRRSTLHHEIGLMRIIDGLIDLFNAYLDTRYAIKANNFSIMHTTTSGNIGCLRDFIIGRLARKYGIKTILHCHYGCLLNDYQKSNFVGKLLRASLKYYDQIWVLDRKTYDFLSALDGFYGKIFLTPNFIDVHQCTIKTKEYKRLAYVGNLIKEKGLFEIISAVKQSNCNIELYIVGPDTDGVSDEMYELIGNEINRKIKVLGQLNNKDAVEFMKTVDIIALPTYYESEAFPISILEAMSLGKFVISTRRAAIPDMLTDIDGNDCGYFVREKCPQDIVDAINWCQSNHMEADKCCTKAYEKVYTAYRKEVVFDLYRQNYTLLASKYLCK